MIIKEKGVILKISETVHGDRLLFILTEGRGRVQAFDASFRSGGKKRSALDLFTYCEFVFYEHSGKYSLNSATVLERFFKLRERIDSASLAGYFAQLCLLATQDGTVVLPKLPSLMLNALYLICHRPEENTKTKTVFEWKIAQFLGFTPSLAGCEHIDFHAKVLLSLADGGLYCPACVPTGGNAPAYPVQAAQVKAIGYILESPPAKAFSFKVNDLKHLARISEEYLRYQTGQEFTALAMYNTLGSEI